MLVWVNACADEVQNFRQIVATNTVLLKENPNNEMSESAGQPLHRDSESEIYVQRTWSKNSRIGTVFCRCVKKLGGLPEVQERNAQVMTERGSQVVKVLTQLRIVEQTKQGNRHGSSPSQMQWATKRDHWRRCVRKGVTDPENPERTFTLTAETVGTKMQHVNNRFPNKGTAWLTWSTGTSSLGEDNSYNQPLKLRDEVRTGKFKIRQTHGQALPEEQDPEYNLAVTCVRERERQMTAGSDLVREESHLASSSSSSLQWEG